ncbi:MAG: DUF1848 domain-containing protein [Chloroflexota bacterium]
MTRTIISASRRTDIPAFHSQWFIDRIRASYCCVANPFNPAQVQRVSLSRDDVAAIVFWTKNAERMLPLLDELEARGYHYYFQYTITGYPGLIEPRTPSLEHSVDTFLRLADRIGPSRVIWRYDPILVTNMTDLDFHKANFTKIASMLKGNTRRVVVSLYDHYRGPTTRLRALSDHGVELNLRPELLPGFDALMSSIASCAGESGLEIASCAEEVDLSGFGIPPGKCIDDDLIRRVLGVEVTDAKDKSQRKRCLCVESRDIGTYDTCLHGCRYCYASRRTDLSLPRLDTRSASGPQIALVDHSNRSDL